MWGCGCVCCVTLSLLYVTASRSLWIDRERRRAELDEARASCGVFKQKKDKNAPKRPLSAYFQFLSVYRNQLREKGASALNDVKQVAKDASVEWNAMSDEDKVPYEKLAVKDRERFKKAMETYTPPADLGFTIVGGNKRQDVGTRKL